VFPPEDRYDCSADLLRTVVSAQSAGEESVSVTDLDDVAPARTTRSDRASHHFGPGVDVILSVSSHFRLPGVPDEEWMRMTSSMGTANMPNG